MSTPCVPKAFFGKRINCEAGANYKAVKPANPNELLPEFPRVAADRLAHAKSLTHGYITCEGINYAQVNLIDDSTLMYYGEDSVVFLLNRIKVKQ